MSFPSAHPTYPQIILFGDSLVEKSFSPSLSGFGAQLSQAYARRADVLNRGLSGYNTTFLLPFLTSLSFSNVLLWVVLVGANDACLPGFVHHVPLKTFKSNLHRIVEFMKATDRGKGKILLVTPPPISTPVLKEKGPRRGLDRAFEHTRAYAEAVLEVGSNLKRGGRESSVEVLDFYHKLWGASGDEESLRAYLTDGLHLGPKGYELLYEGVMEKTREAWPELTPENLRMMAPWWGDLDAVKVFQETKGSEAGEKHDEL